MNCVGGEPERNLWTSEKYIITKVFDPSCQSKSAVRVQSRGWWSLVEKPALYKTSLERSAKKKDSSYVLKRAASDRFSLSLSTSRTAISPRPFLNKKWVIFLKISFTFFVKFWIFIFYFEYTYFKYTSFIFEFVK